MQLTDNTILITRGTSGIGRALASAFHQRGNQVIIAGPRQALLDEITASHRGMRSVLLNLDGRCTIDKFAMYIQDQFPRLNVLVNHFAMSRFDDRATDTSEFANELSAAWSTINSNIIGALHLTAALLPTLKRQPNATIVTTSADLGSIPLAAFPTYFTGKAFLHTRLQTLLRQTNVDVRELAPAYVQTEFTDADTPGTRDLTALNDFIAEVMQILGAPAMRRERKNEDHEQASTTLNEEV